MLRKTIFVASVMLFSTAAFAEGPDMSKMGPWTRPVVKKDDKGVEALCKASEEAWRKQDLNAVVALHDFPIYMATDNAKGVFSGAEWSKETFIKEMSPFLASPPPKDMKMEAKHQIHFLSDTLAVVVTQNKQTLGKQTSSWVSTSLVTQKDGKWLFKTGAEAGWGEDPAAANAKK